MLHLRVDCMFDTANIFMAAVFNATESTGGKGSSYAAKCGLWEIFMNVFEPRLVDSTDCSYHRHSIYDMATILLHLLL